MGHLLLFHPARRVQQEKMARITHFWFLLLSDQKPGVAVCKEVADLVAFVKKSFSKRRCGTQRFQEQLHFPLPSKCFQMRKRNEFQAYESPVSLSL